MIFVAIIQMQFYYKKIKVDKKIVPLRFQVANTAALMKSFEYFKTGELKLEKIEFINKFLKVSGRLKSISQEKFLKKLKSLPFIQVFKYRIEKNGEFKFICMENSLIF